MSLRIPLHKALFPVGALLVGCGTSNGEGVGVQQEVEPSGDAPADDASVEPESAPTAPPGTAAAPDSGVADVSEDPCSRLGLPTVCEELATGALECRVLADERALCSTLDARCDFRACYLTCVDWYCGDLIPDETPEDCFERCEREFYCDASFIPSVRLCDGIADCPSDEDEESEVCIRPDFEFSCLSLEGTISREAICDGFAYCSRGEDEPCPESFDCSPCTCTDSDSNQCPPYIGCSAGERVEITVAADQLLDGTADCPFGEDEHLPEQLSCRTQGRDEWCTELLDTTTGYLCQGTDMRIPRRDVCNGSADCPGGDDEPCDSVGEVCPEQHELVATFLASRDTQDLMGAIIAIQDERLCDLDNTPQDCPFLQCDEGGCYFPCANGQLIRPEKVGNGSFNCPGGEDEPCAPAFTCEGPERLPFDRACNGVMDCSDGSDETDCPRRLEPFTCADGRQIVFPTEPCEGRCADLSDLDGCNRVD